MVKNGLLILNSGKAEIKNAVLEGEIITGEEKNEGRLIYKSL